jgi:glycerophosphoryl diester phosphodiesterase
MKWILQAALLFTAAATLRADTTSCPAYNWQKVMKAARWRNSQISIIAAHRGYWEYVPENSPAAINAAVAICSEMVELDVRLSSDGVPIPIHDWNLERLTTGKGLIYNTPSATWNGLSLKDRTGNVTTPNTPAPTFTQILDTVAANPNLVVGFDCKDAPTVPGQTLPTSYQVLQATWRALMQYELKNPGVDIHDRATFKVLFRELPSNPGQVLTDLSTTNSALNLVAIWYFQDQNNPTFVNGILPNYQPLYQNTNSGTPSASLSFFWWPEAVVKYQIDPANPPAGVPSLQSQISPSTPDGSPNTTAFNPAPDWPEGSSMGSGLCCRTRNTSPVIQYEDPNISDFTGDFEYLYAQTFCWFSSDKITDAIAYFKARGQRNTTLISGN